MNKLILDFLCEGKTDAILFSDTEDLVTVMICNEIFDPKEPDTFF